MKGIAPEHLEQVGKYVSDSVGEAISLATLAQKLGVRYPTAKRRLAAYAAFHRMTLQSATARVGLRGPESVTWYLRPQAPTSVPVDPQVRAAFMANVPRALKDAVPRGALLKRVLSALPRELKKATKESSFAALLAMEGVVTTRDGLLYLAPRVEKASPLSPTLSPAGEREALGLSASVVSALTGDELLALQLLAKTGSARTSELVVSIGHSPDRVGGMMRGLRHKLHDLGANVFVDETLPDGEPLFRYLPLDER